MITLPGIEDVSRETSDRLVLLDALLKKWNPAINLVSKTSLHKAWDRHIVDSAQLYGLGPRVGHWVDLGSGGGLPGLVVACLAAGQGDPLRVTLIESDQRKAAFLRVAAQDLSLRVDVLSTRIETAPPQAADVVSARALAALPALLGYAVRHLAPGGLCLFPKGAAWRQEVEQARKGWHFDVQIHPSTTESAGAILELKAVSHV